MNRRLPIVGALATLVAGGIVLALKLRAMSGEPDVAKDAPVEPNARRDERPRLTDRTASPASTPDMPTVETRVDGSKVRDHRTGERVPYEGRTTGSGGAHRDRLPAQLVRDITEKLKVGLADCAARVPAEARGARPGIRGSVSVDVAGGTLTVKEASIEVVDVTGEPSGIAQCLKESWLGQSTPAADTPEIANYPITVAFSLPSR